ncbi:nuclear transport factor 2 family protein [Sphingobium phenoxybenzoativorans]|uniref:nuclear transport factor 2 family protein n=1 Tax=Sphingobium phenoxybenzoativorans TaxID=1592790 RepID=UPI000872C6CA|nr:nuclear transport factor 2 family protein [Sphingobium phenoxybenzoativorans]
MDIETLLAKHEIMDLRLGYAAHLDARDYDSFMDLFTEDAVCEFGPEYGGDWVGRAQIRERYEEVMLSAGGAFDAIHVVTNPWITLTGPDTAHGRWYLLDCLTRQMPVTGLHTQGGHNNPLLYLGIYEDDYRREAGKWRIARTRLHFLWPERKFEALAHPSGR